MRAWVLPKRKQGQKKPFRPRWVGVLVGVVFVRYGGFGCLYRKGVCLGLDDG